MCHIIISTLNPLTHGKWAHSWLNRKNVLSPGRDASSAFHPQTYKPFFLPSLLPHCQSVPLLDKAVSSLVTLETVLSPLPGSVAVQLFSTLYLMLLSPSQVSLTHCSFQVEFLSVLSIHPSFHAHSIFLRLWGFSASPSVCNSLPCSHHIIWFICVPIKVQLRCQLFQVPFSFWRLY